MTLSSTRTGFALMALSALFFSLMSASVRLADAVPAHTLAFVRFAFGAAVVLLLGVTGRARLRSRNKPFLIGRGLLGGMAVYLFYLAICKVGLAKGTVLASEGFWPMMHCSRTDWAMLLGSIHLIIEGGGKWSVDRSVPNDQA